MAYAGVADLPLHTGHVPAWLAAYMKKLARAIMEAVVEFYGPRRLVEYFADPVWFQAFNNAIGMDWDSSGSTTVTIGIVRQVVEETPHLGIGVAGGKGRRARETPKDLEIIGERLGLPSRIVEELKYVSRLAAKTDSAVLQDGYTLYHHSVIVSEDGAWVVIQQGMNVEAKMARRYHWRSPLPRTPTLEPHSAIASQRREDFVVDLTSRKSLEARRLIVDLASENPSRLASSIREAYALAKGIVPLTMWSNVRDEARRVIEQYRRYYRPQLKPPKNIEAVLRRVWELSPRSFEELVMIEGVGPATLRSLALVAEIIYGVPISHHDPASSPIDPFRYAYIAGGKDGVPFPFRRDYAEKVLEFLEAVIREARLDEKSKRRALARIQRLASLLPK
ncbi:DUF763 domain-containing protein [Hyperthermus butylicus]|uniref:Universally conserved protein n=1 Tax=Hyperthermus butylicus (strain DSM 5456 / JCM 9403 / PLM1-5) TaxID=415426 RepID=A2BK07_HYPBU|nr:DUF763 domain-containing protein [Hyperthermus butylicus]ABM80318.1 universally conserved protein [Hyperthermus butylicus DSM 5456]